MNKTTNDGEGGRRILGLGKGWFVYRRAGKGVEIGIEGGKHKVLWGFILQFLAPSWYSQMPTLTDPQSRVLLSTNPTRRLLGSEGGRKYQEVDGFLRLTSRHDRENDQAYRSIANDDRDSASESSDPDGGDSDDDSDWTPTSAHQASLIELERKLNADPGSVPSWLSLLSQTLLTVPWTSKNATKSRSEITLSIIARALSAHPDNSLSTVLRRKYLNAGEEIWHESKLRAEWENALKLGSVEIWMEWLEWRIRRASDGVDGAIEDARRVLAHFIKEEDEIARVRVFWRVAVVLQNGGASSRTPKMISHRVAGYPERCMAMFQAQVELYVLFWGSIFPTGLIVALAPSTSHKHITASPWTHSWMRLNNFGKLKFLEWAKQGPKVGLPLCRPTNPLHQCHGARQFLRPSQILILNGLPPSYI
jgi:hypothetical protein